MRFCENVDLIRSSREGGELELKEKVDRVLRWRFPFESTRAKGRSVLDCGKTADGKGRKGRERENTHP